MRPHIAGVMAQFVHGCVQRHRTCVAKQAMSAQPLRSGTGGNVLGVALGGLHAAPVLLQRQRNESRCVGFGGGSFVVVVLQQFFCVGEIFHQFLDDLLLLACRRTVIRHDLYPLTGGDVLQISAGVLSTAAFDVGALDDQPCHSSFSCSRSFCSIRRRPWVRLIVAMLLARSCRSTDSSTLTLCSRMERAISISTACL